MRADLPKTDSWASVEGAQPTVSQIALARDYGVLQGIVRFGVSLATPVVDARATESVINNVLQDMAARVARIRICCNIRGYQL